MEILLPEIDGPKIAPSTLQVYKHGQGIVLPHKNIRKHDFFLKTL